MHLESLDGTSFKKMFLGGVSRLNHRKQELNDLNVFPVPDGDTGTNMMLTIQAAVGEVKKVTDNSVNSMAKAISMGSLMGARGNSGVILSQLFRGFAKGVEGKEVIDAMDFAKALQEGVNSAYNAVLKPVEGTMLTVAKESAKAAINAARRDKNLVYVLKTVVEQSLETVDKTPSLLPILKQAGVVDAGGKGVYYLYAGFLQVLLHPELEDLEDFPEEEETGIGAEPTAKFSDLGEIEFGYCTELFIRGEKLSATPLQVKLSLLGDSLLVVGEEDLLKVHVHTNNPGRVLEICSEMGSLHKIKIDNMREQHQETQWSAADTSEEAVDEVESKGIGVITVAAGSGFKELLLSLGVDAIIEGGQTMNPSTEDFIKEVDKLSTQKVIILPNNKNIILAAEQAKKLSKKEIEVVPSTTIPQGIAALLSLNKVELSLEENGRKMRSALQSVKTGQVTLAVRDSKYNGHAISKGDYIGMYNGELTVVKTSLEEAVESLLESMVEEEDEIITFYHGQDISQEVAADTGEKAAQRYPNLDIEIYKGGQPLYHFVISIE